MAVNATTGIRQGSRALITGGGRGLGATIAGDLASAGLQVAIWDAPAEPAWTPYGLTDAAQLSEAATAICTTHAASVDVRDPVQVKAEMERTVDALGGLDTLVCAAGIRTIATAVTMRDDIWDDLIDTNLHGTYHVLREAIHYLEEADGGRAVVVSAEEGRRGAYGLAHYSAASWGQIGLVKSLALEAADRGVSVSVVCPGVMDTVMSAHPAFWELVESGRDGRGFVDGPDRARAEHALRVRHPSSATYVSEAEVSRAVRFLLTASTTDFAGAVIDVSSGLAAANSM